MLKRYFTSALLLLASAGSAQTVYFHQNFSETTSLVNPQPDTGQFSHIILTAPALSYHKFHKGYMELTRTRLDSATGGVIRAMRATPFTPNPETLIVRMTLTAEGIQQSAVNALYLYAGENFNPVNNSFPGNGLMFAKCSVNFLEDGFNVKDLETQQASARYPEKTLIRLTWVLNNSDKPLEYGITGSGAHEAALPGTYDLWVNDQPVAKGSEAYPGLSPYSKTKLSNFEMRFRNGVGKIRIDEILIDDGKPVTDKNDVSIAPNPAKRDEIWIFGNAVNAASVRLVDASGRILPVRTASADPGKLKVTPLTPVASGIHILQWETRSGGKHSSKVLIE